MLKNRRKLLSYFIEPLKQFKFSLYSTGISIFFLIIAMYVFVKGYIEQYNQMIEIFNVISIEGQWELILNDVFIKNIIKVGIVLLIFFIVLTFTMFKITHRYYGPLISIEKFIDEIEKGNFSKRIELRKKDELKKLANKLNLMADYLEKNFNKK